MNAMGGWHAARNRITRFLTGADFARLQAEADDAAAWRRDAASRFDELNRFAQAQTAFIKDQRDATEVAVARLEALRGSAAYASDFDDPEPLISVRIASYRKSRELVEVAIASVLAQTYQRFEIVVVNDGPNDATRTLVEAIGDDRIRYHELPVRSTYPAHPHWRWMVAGAPGMNRSAELAHGTWLAPLDDDDEFASDHLASLLDLARSSRAELAYGALIQRNEVNDTESVIYSEPPQISQFSFQGSIYLRSLHEIFPYDEASWIVGEPGDWNLIRRLSAAGVRMASTSQIQGIMHQVPFTHKEDGD